MSEKHTTLAQVYETSKRELGDKIIAPDNLDPREFIEFKRIMQEHPMLFSGLRFPMNPNTNEPMIDMDRILVNRRLFCTINKLGMFRGQIMSEYDGEGSVYNETIYGRGDGGIMTATSIKSQRAKPPEPPRGNLMFSPFLPDTYIKRGFGKPIAVHKLNRTALNERLDELVGDPKHPMTNDKAWAVAMEESMRNSIAKRNAELANENFPITSTVITGGETLMLPFPSMLLSDDRWSRMAGAISAAALVGGYTLDLLSMGATRKQLKNIGRNLDFNGVCDEDVSSDDEMSEYIPISPYIDEATAPNEWRISLFSPGCMHLDSYLAVRALMNNGKLIRYRE